MEKKKEKKKGSYWLFTELALILAVIVMLVRFSSQSTKREQSEVENQMVSALQVYAMQVEKNLGGMEKSIQTAADYVGADLDNEERTRGIMASAKQVSGLYEIVCCTLEGKGYNLSGEKVNLSETDYFSEIVQEDTGYIYIPDDGMTGKPAVMIAAPVRSGSVLKGYIVGYSDASFFKTLVGRSNFGADAYYLFLTPGSSILAMTGSTDGVRCEEGAVYSAFLSESGDNRRAVDTLKMRMHNSQSDVCEIKVGKETRYIAFTPICEGRFYLLGGASDSYFKKQLEGERKGSKSLAVQLSIVMVIFMIVIVANGIVIRVKEKENSRKLENKADTDQLTDLLNKLATEGKIKDRIATHPNELGLMLVLDIDNFKKINDTMGHAFGDEVLRTLGKQMRATFRSTDIIGRTGGDEFTIFLCNMKDTNIIRNEAKRIENFFRTFQAGEYVKYAATASIGAAIFPMDAKDFESLYKAADSALYVAKNRGKNQMAFYNEDDFEKKDDK